MGSLTRGTKLDYDWIDNKPIYYGNNISIPLIRLEIREQVKKAIEESNNGSTES